MAPFPFPSPSPSFLPAPQKKQQAKNPPHTTHPPPPPPPTTPTPSPPPRRNKLPAPLDPRSWRPLSRHSEHAAAGRRGGRASGAVCCRVVGRRGVRRGRGGGAGGCGRRSVGSFCLLVFRVLSLMKWDFIYARRSREGKGEGRGGGRM